MSLPDRQIPDQWKRDALNDKEENILLDSFGGYY